MNKEFLLQNLYIKARSLGRSICYSICCQRGNFDHLITVSVAPLVPWVLLFAVLLVKISFYNVCCKCIWYVPGRFIYCNNVHTPLIIGLGSFSSRNAKLRSLFPYHLSKMGSCSKGRSDGRN